MDVRIFYCNTFYTASLIEALVHLGVLAPSELTVKNALGQKWWYSIDKLTPGEFFEIGCDESGTRVLIVSAPHDTELLSTIAHTFVKALNPNYRLHFCGASTSDNFWLNGVRWLARIFGTRGPIRALFVWSLMKKGRESFKNGKY